jgi:hypothetical protein
MITSIGVMLMVVIMQNIILGNYGLTDSGGLAIQDMSLYIGINYPPSHLFHMKGPFVNILIMILV